MICLQDSAAANSYTLRLAMQQTSTSVAAPRTSNDT